MQLEKQKIARGHSQYWQLLPIFLEHADNLHVIFPSLYSVTLFCNKHSMFKVVFIVPQKEKSVLDYRKCCEEKELEICLKSTYKVQVDNR